MSYVFPMYFISPEAESCAGHNSHTASDNLIIFDRDINQVKQKCHMQEEQLFLDSFF